MERHDVRVPTEARIDNYRIKLQAERLAYTAAMEKIHRLPMDKSHVETLMEILALCQRYRAGDDAVGAVYLLAQVADRLESLLAPWQVVETFEALQGRLRTLEETHG